MDIDCHCPALEQRTIANPASQINPKPTKASLATNDAVPAHLWHAKGRSTALLSGLCGRYRTRTYNLAFIDIRVH